MGTGGRRGRRDNGLEATEYAVAGDVDPRVGEHLLDVLAGAGIAAYLQPAADLHPVTRTTTMPSRPTDRLYVDREHLATARDFLAQVADTPAPTTDVDAAWARIVADLRSDLDPASASWPDSGSGPPAPDRRAHADSDPRERSLLDGLDTFGADLPGDDDEGSYTPPPPPPLPRLSKVTVAAILAILAGFTMFIWPELVPIGAGVTRFFGFVACFAGFATLVWRLRPGDEEDDGVSDSDDGAVV